MIKKNDFESLKPLDRVNGSAGYMGWLWKVESVTNDGPIKIVVLRRSSGQNVISCRWDDEKGRVVDSETGEVIADFGGHAYLSKEGVDQLVEEMLSNKELSPEQAERLLQANRNDINRGIALGCDSF